MKFLVLYRPDAAAFANRPKPTPEQYAEGVRQWDAWFSKAGHALVDKGSPVLGDPAIGGFSILQAASREELDALLADHPWHQVGTLDALEYAPPMGSPAR